MRKGGRGDGRGRGREVREMGGGRSKEGNRRGKGEEGIGRAAGGWGARVLPKRRSDPCYMFRYTRIGIGHATGSAVAVYHLPPVGDHRGNDVIIQNNSPAYGVLLGRI